MSPFQRPIGNRSGLLRPRDNGLWRRGGPSLGKDDVTDGCDSLGHLASGLWISTFEQHRRATHMGRPAARPSRLHCWRRETGAGSLRILQPIARNRSDRRGKARLSMHHRRGAQRQHQVWLLVITFRLNIDDTPTHLVASRSYVRYLCGSKEYARVIDLAVDERRPLEAKPAIARLVAVASPEGSCCEGSLELARYTTPRASVRRVRISPTDLDGDVSISKDGGWSPPEQDAGYLKSVRRLSLRTKPTAASSGTAKLNLVSGEPPVPRDSIAIHWSHEALALMEPRTVLISKDRPSCRIQIVSHIGRPRNVTWKVPEGFRMERTENPKDGNEIAVTVLPVERFDRRGNRERSLSLLLSTTAIEASN